MDKRELLLTMRKDHTLKGLKPAFVNLRMNTGQIYYGPYGEFIMSLRNDILYFQKISTFLKRRQPKYDFEVKCARFSSYTIDVKSYMKTLYLYEESGRFMEIGYMYGTKASASSDENIYRIIEELKKTIGLVEASDGEEQE